MKITVLTLTLKFGLFLLKIRDKKRIILKLLVNLGLLLFGSSTVFSGLLIQVKYHMGNHGIIDNNSVFGINYAGWSDIHKVSIVFITLISVFHIIQHWDWYRIIIKKKLITKNKQTVGLTLVFIVVVITGYIPWIINLIGGNEITRKTFIEMHDKLALVLLVYFILHVSKRLKWYIITFKKLE